MKKYFIYLCSLLILILCVSAKPIKLKPKEAIVIGRVVINIDNSNMEINYEKITIAFLNATNKTKKVKLSKDGFFCMKIGINNSFVDYLQYKNGGDFRKIFTENCITFNLPEGEKIYYLGDIEVVWTPSDRDKIKQAFALGIGMGGPHMGGAVNVPISSGYAPQEDCPPIIILNYNDAEKWYKTLYPDDDREIVTNFVNLPN